MQIDGPDTTDQPGAAGQDDNAIADLLGQAIAKHHAWEFDEAQRLYQAILQQQPGHADAHHNLGVLLAIQLLKPQEALPHFEAALNAEAGNSQYWFSYIDALIRVGQLEFARNILTTARAMGLKPVQANALEERLNTAAAERAPTRVAPVAQAPSAQGAVEGKKKKPKKNKDIPAAAQTELMALFRQHAFEKGEALARELVEQYPDSGFAWKALGVMLQPQEKMAEALVAKRKAAALLPADAEAHCNLGYLLQESGEFDAALKALERALKLRPSYPEAYNNIAIVYQRQGQIERSVEAFSRAVAGYGDAPIDRPGYASTFSNYLFTLNYDPDRSAQEIYAAYEEYDRRFALPFKGQWRAHGNDRTPGRRLRVGYVSPDFRNHSTRNFLEPLLAQHDRQAVEVYAYADLATEDEVTQRYKSYVDHWVATRGMSDEVLAERIRTDGIDVLVDLAGHSQGHRLGVFARKPAPVSASWMGFGYTTGLKAIDYYLTDEASVPQGSEDLFSEMPWRMKGFPGVYQAQAGMGEVSALPALEKGYVTFGTLTRAIRVNHRTIRVWSEILKRVPGAHLVIDSSSYKDAGVREVLVKRFEAHGVRREQLEIGFHSPPWDVLRGMDIGLDCFPHNSGTTLFESLYMGVPFITLAGRPSVGRLGSCILQGVGHPEWIANSEEEYIEKAVALASDLGALSQTRATLRPQMQASAVMDEADFVRRVEQAYRCMFQQWIDRTPEVAQEAPAPEEMHRLVEVFQRGDYSEGERRALEITRLYPRHGYGWKLLGAFQQKLGDLKGALAAKKMACELLPHDMEALFNLAMSYEKLGFWKEAEDRYRQLLTVNPNDMEVLNNLGNVLWKQFDTEQAEIFYRKALAAQPAGALDARRNLGALLASSGRLVDEETHWRQTLQEFPDLAEANNGLARALVRQGRMAEAETVFRNALKNKAEDHEYYFLLGVALSELGKTGEAIEAYKKSLSIQPKVPTTLNNLAILLEETGRITEAETYELRALALGQNSPLVLNNYARNMQLQGRQAESVQAFEKTVQLMPNNSGMYGNYLFSLNYEPDRSAQEIYAAYEEYDRRFALPLKGEWRAHGNDRTPGRRLRVGYVSPDFRAHSVSNFLEPLLAQHDPQAVEVYAYADLAREDEVTQRYKSYVDHWVATRGMSDEALAERIRADGIDVLVDLAGHTAHNRLGVFARKPAPVSVSWLGFGYTTGLKAIDYFLTDEVAAPPGCDELFSERPWRMEGLACVYRSQESMGEVNALPALTKGHVTFGTLTRAIRVNHRTIRVWAEILKRMPDAHLVVDSSSYRDVGVREALVKRFEAHGVRREQLEIGFHSPPWDVLRGMDIGLDCFPHNSGTTLFESLYMGVPFITLAGRPSVGRLGSTILHGTGHPEWIASSEDEYIEKAVALASDLGALSKIRATLRPKMQAGAVMDEAGFVRRVEQAYRGMFQKWVESKQ